VLRPKFERTRCKLKAKVDVHPVKCCQMQTIGNGFNRVKIEEVELEHITSALATHPL